MDGFVKRMYREQVRRDDLAHFRIVVKQTDLAILISPKSFGPEIPTFVEQLVIDLREQLEAYISQEPEFARSLVPVPVHPGAPPIAVEMALAAKTAGVGPMAAVAGAYAAYVGLALAAKAPEVIVENGGDLFLRIKRKRYIGVFAGSSPLSGKLAVVITPDQSPLGVCTSSGTVGPSLSLGRADASMILASSAALADAAASAVGNVVGGPEDVNKALAVAQSIQGVRGAVVICGDQLAVWGEVQLVKWNP